MTTWSWGERPRMVATTSGAAFCSQTLKVQYDWGRYWYATSETIPYGRTGACGARQTARPAKPSGIQEAYLEDSSGMQTPHFAGGMGSARMRSLVLRQFERETEAQLQIKREQKWH